MAKTNILIEAGLVAVLAAGCTDEPATYRTLEAAGFSHIQIDGYAFWGCGEDDNFYTKFTATNPNGKRVSGIVCSGLTKGATIRF